MGRKTVENAFGREGNILFMKFDNRQLVYMSFLIGLSIVLTRLYNIHIGLVTFGGFPIILAGFLFGPLSGGIVGFLADILGFILVPSGPYLPWFTLTSSLAGVIPALLLLPFKQKVPALWKIMAAIFLGQLTTNVLLVSYFQQIYFGIPMAVAVPIKLFNQTVHALLYGFLVWKILCFFHYGKFSPIADKFH